MPPRKPNPRPLARRRSVVLGIAALALVAGGIGLYVHHERDIDRDRALADQALDRLDLSAAVGHLRDYLAHRPDDADASLLLARTLRRDGKLDEARKQLTAARRLGHDADAARREALLLDTQASARDRSTDELLATVGEVNPDRDLLEALYRGDQTVGNWDRAALWLQLWLKAYPDDWPPRLWEAEIFERFRKYDTARNDYLRVLELRPDQPRALLGAGQVALEQHAEYAEAETYLNRYLAIDPGHQGARLSLALCRYGRGELAGARELAQGVLDEKPEHAGAALLLGSLEAEAGRDDEALRWLRVAEAGNADPQGVSYQLAQVLRHTGQTAEADRYARHYAELRDVQRALESATRAAEREPTNADRLYEVGRLYQKLGAADAAASWFLKALAQDPKHKPSHAALADFYAHQPDPRAAARAEFHRRQAQGDAGRR